MGKISLDKTAPYIAGVCLPLFVSAIQAEPISKLSIEASARTANRRMKELLSQTPSPQSIQQLILNAEVIKAELSAQDFLLKNYTEVAIATDLEPDDVLALAILFEEANRIYEQSPHAKYPIDLIIVGEGNTAIKRMRMEKLLQEYFDIPPGVNIKVVEGRATKDNIFSYDGQEFFGKETLERIPFPEPNQGEQALEALSAWVEQAKDPFVIQLKPAPELAYLEPDLANKTTVLFYGSFNIRKTIWDPAILNDPQFAFGNLSTTSARLEALMSHISSRFSKIAILETFGVLGDQSCVCSEFEWTSKIGQMIATSDDKFIEMFRTVSSNWNTYILDKFLGDCERISNELIREGGDFTNLLRDIHSDIVLLQKEWAQDRFDNLYQNILNHSSEISSKLNEDAGRDWKTLTRKISLAKKIISDDVQFTLSDVLVAMATTDDSQFFQAAPIKISYDENGFLVPIADSTSNVVYYSAVDREKLAGALEQFLTYLDLRFRR